MPSVSPGKTWEGFLGAGMITLIVGYILSTVYDQYSMQSWILIALFVWLFGSIGDLVEVQEKNNEKSIYRKNQKRVVYVKADMAGALESPAYAILGMESKLKEIPLPKGYQLEEQYLGQPAYEDNYTVKWDGEWQITLEVFRDLGIAFLGAIIIIYMW